MKPIQIKNPLVVGYKGEIGSFILNGLLKTMPKALNIWCVDVNESEQEVIDRIRKSDTIFLCVPLNKTLEWLLHFKPLLQDNIIIEQTSLKRWLSDSRLEGLDIRSMHILFRPSQTPNIEDRRVAVLNNHFENDILKEIAKITSSLWERYVFFNNAEQHDKEMAVQQALVHRTLLVLGSFLRKSHGSTYISKKVLELCERIKKGDLDLYTKI